MLLGHESASGGTHETFVTPSFFETSSCEPTLNFSPAFIRSDQGDAVVHFLGPIASGQSKSVTYAYQGT